MVGGFAIFLGFDFAGWCGVTSGGCFGSGLGCCFRFVGLDWILISKLGLVVMSVVFLVVVGGCLVWVLWVCCCW